MLSGWGWEAWTPKRRSAVGFMHHPTGGRQREYWRGGFFEAPWLILKDTMVCLSDASRGESKITCEYGSFMRKPGQRKKKCRDQKKKQRQEKKPLKHWLS